MKQYDTNKVDALLRAAEAVWESAAEGGAGSTAIVSGNDIRRLALAVCDLTEADEEMRSFAEDWPTT